MENLNGNNENKDKNTAENGSGTSSGEEEKALEGNENKPEAGKVQEEQKSEEKPQDSDNSKDKSTAGNGSGTSSGEEKDTPEGNENKPEAGRKQEELQPEEKTQDNDDAQNNKAEKGGKHSGGKKGKHVFKNYIHSNKFRRTSLSTAFTVGFIAIVVFINVIVGILGNKFPSMNVDMTKNGLNSLSSQSIKVVDSVKTPVTIYVLVSKQQAESDTSYHQVNSLTAKMSERNRKISVQYVDLDKNPTFTSNYKNEKLQSGDIIVKSSKRYRLLTYSDLFTQQYSSDYTSTETYSNVDSALASALNTVMSDKLPLAAFDTGHSENLDSTAYKTLLENNSFKADDFSLLTDKIPTDAQLVVLGCPTTDLTDSEVNKLDKFLSDKTLAADRSLVVTFSPGQKSMPKLSAFLKEWGIAPQQDGVILESNQKKYWYNPEQNYSQANILADIQSTPDIGSGTSDYGTYFTTPFAEPINILFQSKGTKSTYSLIKSSDGSYLVTNETQSTEGLKKTSYNLAALSQDSVNVGSKSYKSNVIVCGSSQMFADGIINASSFANGKYIAALSKYAAGTANSENQVTVEPKSANVKDITLNANATNVFGVWIFMILIPLAIAVAGIVVYTRRAKL